MPTLQELGITLQCIRGEEWPTTSFSYLLDLKQETVGPGSITFSCPMRHSFTLEQALNKGLYTSDMGERILARARLEFAEAKKTYEQRKREGWRVRPSDLIPNQEVVAKGWSCVKCGNPAQASLDDPPTQSLVICNGCRAAWTNFHYDHRAAFGVFYGTRGRPYELFRGLMWRKFLNNEGGIPTEAQAKELLVEFRKQAQQESRERARAKRRR